MRPVRVLEYFCVVIFVSWTRVTSVRPLSEEELLMRDLFVDYNPSARPVLHSKSTVNVSMLFSLLHIQDLVSDVNHACSSVYFNCMYMYITNQIAVNQIQKRMAFPKQLPAFFV